MGAVDVLWLKGVYIDAVNIQGITLLGMVYVEGYSSAE